jgi:hypothetical protein
MLEEIRKSGRIKIIDEPDRNAFQAKVDSAYANLAKRWGDDNWNRLRAEIRAVRGN